jgi:hypothetical protein
MTCDVGSCVHTSDQNFPYVCSNGGSCQACINDSDIDPQTGKPRIDSDKQGQCGVEPGSGLPIMCISNKCAAVNPNNPPKIGSYGKDNYIACTNASCLSDANCSANQKCNDNHVCIIANQGTPCMTDGDCRTQDGYQCKKQQTPGGWLSVCCKNGDINGCLGCSSDNGCATGTFCLNQSRVALAKSGSLFDSSLVGRCVNSLPSGGSCDNDKMCQTGQCVNGRCSTSVKIYECDDSIIQSIAAGGVKVTPDEYCSTYAGGPLLGTSYTCNIYKKCSNGTSTYSP